MIDQPQRKSYFREEEVVSLVHRLQGISFGRDFSEGGKHKKHGFQKMLDDYQELLRGFSVGDFFFLRWSLYTT